MASMPDIGIRINSNTVCRKIGDSHYLVPISGNLASTGYTIKLNDLAATLWNKISSGDAVTLQDLVTFTTSEYKVSDDTALSDIYAFLDSLANIGIITMDSG